MNIGDFYKHDHVCEIIEFPPNLYSRHCKTAETEMIIIQFHTGKCGRVQLTLEEFEEDYRPHRAFSKIFERERLK